MAHAGGAHQDRIAVLANGILAGNRANLAQAITLVESHRADHRADALALLEHLHPHMGKAIRIGLTGVPGVGKSTTIDRLGCQLMDNGHKIAVLAVDPSSKRTGGAILGDKTRMSALAARRDAYIRPSPSSGTLGGVASRTRETMLLCEAAGFDVILVETVGTGQSEVAVADMVDLFVVLMLPGAGDDLQGIKKGVLELADLIAVNKADGETRQAAEQAAGQYRAALHILTSGDADWSPKVVTLSGLTGAGLQDFWTNVLAFQEIMTGNGRWASKRADQRVKWMWALYEQRLAALIEHHPDLQALAQELERVVRAGSRQPDAASHELLRAVLRAHSAEGN